MPNLHYFDRLDGWETYTNYCISSDEDQKFISSKTLNGVLVDTIKGKLKFKPLVWYNLNWRTPNLNGCIMLVKIIWMWNVLALQISVWGSIIHRITRITWSHSNKIIVQRIIYRCKSGIECDKDPFNFAANGVIWHNFSNSSYSNKDVSDQKKIQLWFESLQLLWM